MYIHIKYFQKIYQVSFFDKQTSDVKINCKQYIIEIKKCFVLLLAKSMKTSIVIALGT